jgi:WD40 repeat protein/serine/threonine protein kinase
MHESTHERELVERLAEEFVERYRAGERPSLDEYVAAHPRHADEIRDLFPALVLMEELAPSDSGVTTSAGAAPADVGAPLERVGDYRLLREVGRGGMGVVYEAEQESLGRRVALKVVRWQAGQDPRVLARFRRESRAAAQLHHTNIVPVYEVGQQDGLCYYAMQFIRGQALDEVFRELRNLRAGSETRAADGNEPAALPDRSELSSVASNFSRYARNVARLGQQAAQALAYAHERGVIHRDIKPANLLLDTTGVVWVSDFGLAKTEEQALTETGDLVGTLRYMAPERFQGECDARADTYALGLTLYELLALRPAFDAQDRLHLIEQIRQQEPARLRKVDPRISRDLETIVMKAIEKDPRRRYASAEALAEDLRRFGADEPIKARRIGPLERLGRWGRRNPLVASLSAAVVLVAALGFVGVFGQWQVAVAHEQQAAANAAQAQKNEQQANANAVQAKQKEQEAKKDRDEVKALNEKLQATLKELQATQEQLRHTLYASRMNLAQYAWEAGDIERVQAFLELQHPKMGETDLRNFEWHYLNRLGHSDLLTLKHNGTVDCLAYSPDGKRLATVASFGAPKLASVVTVWDAQTGKELLSFKEKGLHSVAFSLDGKRLATPLGGNSEVKEWDAETGKELRTFQTDPKKAGGWWNCVAYSPDGKHLAAGCGFREVTVWDTKSGKELFTLKGHTSVHSVAFTSDVKRLATASEDKTVKVWDAKNGKELLTLPVQSAAVQSVAFSPDGKQLATTAGGKVTIWDAETGKELRAIQENAAVGGLAYSPDGKRLASVLADNSVRLWDAKTGEPLFTFRGHSRTIVRVEFAIVASASVAFRPDGKHLASAALDKTVKVWDVQTSQEPLTLKLGVLQEPKSIFTPAVISPDGKLVASAGGKSVFSAGPNDGVTKVWDIQTGKELITLKENPISLAFSLDSKQLATNSLNSNLLNKVKVWDLQTGKELMSLEGRELLKLAYSPDGKRLVGFFFKGNVKVWDAQTGKELLVFQSSRGNAIFSSDGKRLAIAWGKETQLWDTQTGKEIQSFKFRSIDDLHNPAFSPDGKLLAAASGEEIKLWDTQTGKEVRSFKSSGVGVVFSPDGKRLASRPRFLGSANDVTVWDVETGNELLTLKGYAGVYKVAFSPDGKRLVSASRDMFKVWDAQSGQELLTLRENGILSVAFTPDGRRLVIGTEDGTVRIYDATPLPEKP